jgi:hypothetical protein
LFARFLSGRYSSKDILSAKNLDAAAHNADAAALMRVGQAKDEVGAEKCDNSQATQLARSPILCRVFTLLDQLVSYRFLSMFSVLHLCVHIVTLAVASKRCCCLMLAAWRAKSANCTIH